MILENLQVFWLRGIFYDRFVCERIFVISLHLRDFENLRDFVLKSPFGKAHFLDFHRSELGTCRIN